MSFVHSHSWILAAPPAVVFRALVEPAELVEWFAQGAQVEPRVGGVYRFWGRHTLGTPPEDAARQVITRFEPNEWIAFEWPIFEVDTDVTMHLEPAPNGTRLTLTHNVWGDINLPRPRDQISDFWRVALANLAAHLEGTGEVRLPDYLTISSR